MQKLLILKKMVVFGQSGCIRVKKCSIRAKVVVIW